ncbi:MAG: hypothetical protein WBG08_02220 [Litorimonas sp.]
MSKRRRKSQMFTDPVEIDPAFADLEAPKTKRPKGKAWAKARKNNRKGGF